MMGAIRSRLESRGGWRGLGVGDKKMVDRKMGPSVMVSYFLVLHFPVFQSG